jgi:hypothetical protein
MVEQVEEAATSKDQQGVGHKGCQANTVHVTKMVIYKNGDMQYCNFINEVDCDNKI